MANFGDIQTNLALGASQSVRRNSGDAAFEAYTPLTASDVSNAKSGSFGIAINGGTTVLTTGLKGTLVVPYSGTITSWTLVETSSTPISTTTVLDVWKDTYANYPPTVADTITASAKPTLTAATKNTSSTLTGWTTSVTAGDVLCFNIDSNNNAKNLLLIINITKS